MTIVYQQPLLDYRVKSEYGTFCTNPSDAPNMCIMNKNTENSMRLDFTTLKPESMKNPKSEDAVVQDCQISWYDISSVTDSTAPLKLILLRAVEEPSINVGVLVKMPLLINACMSMANNSLNSDKLILVQIILKSLVSWKYTCNKIFEFLNSVNSSSNVILYSIYNPGFYTRLCGMINLTELNEGAMASSVLYVEVSFNNILVHAPYFMVYTELGVLYISQMDMQLVTETANVKLILNVLYYNVNDTLTNCIAILTWLNVVGLVRSTFKSLTDTKSDSRFVMETSREESEQSRQIENGTCEKDMDSRSIQEQDMYSHNSDISVRQVIHTPLEHVSSPLDSQQLWLTESEPRSTILLKSQYGKLICKLIPDTIGLKSRHHIEDIVVESKPDVEKEENSDIIELMRKRTKQPLTDHQVYTVAPVHKAQEEKEKEMSSSTNDKSQVEIDSVLSDSIHLNEYGPSQVEDTSMTSAISPLMERHNEIYSGACIEQDCSSVVQIDTSVCTKEPLQMKSASSWVQHAEDTNSTECSNVIEDSLLPTVASLPDIDSENLPNPRVDEAAIQRFEPLLQVINKLADGQRVPPQITMQYEMLRFCTLRSFPKVNKPYITRIAEAGFYYANDGDEVVCYCCARRRRNWQETDIPMDVHRQMSPTCSFLVRNSEVNVSIKNQLQTTNTLSDMPNNTVTVLPSSHNHILPQSYEAGVHENSISTAAVNKTAQHTAQDNSVQTIPTVTTAHNTQNRETLNFPKQTSASSYATAQNRAQTRAHGNFVQAISSQASSSTTGTRETQLLTAPSSSGSTGEASAANGIEGTAKSAMPKYPKYASITVRRASYNSCAHIVISPDRLAESGLFYAGFGDCVRCFQCGVGLRHWSEEDDPWIEHSRWRKECSFVAQRKGQEFVNLVQMAIQYSENNEDQGPDDRTSLSTEGGNQIQQQNREEIGNLMHTDAAQSVLEMGYHPNIIRKAVRRVFGQRGREGISATNLMEIIFEIETEATPDIDETVEHSTTQSSENTTTSNQTGQENNSVPTTSSPLATSTSTNTYGVSRRETSSENIAASRTAASKSSCTVAQTVSPYTSTSTLQSVPSTSSAAEARSTSKSLILEQKKLKAENEKLKQQSICITCKKNDVCIVFLPCGHLVTCEECAPTVSYCTCGTYIKGTVRTYLS